LKLLCGRHPPGREIIIWDNGSTDDTASFLKELESEKDIQVVYHDSNIGINGKGMAIQRTVGEFIIGVDNDVIMLPDGWVEKMMKAFEKEKKLGFLALDVVQDEYTNGAKPPESRYKNVAYGDGIVHQYGPVGGWCCMMKRSVYRDVGDFRYNHKSIVYCEEGDYLFRCKLKGYSAAILKDVKCYHATGAHYSGAQYDAEKWSHLDKMDMYLHRIRLVLQFIAYRLKTVFTGRG
jgi:GT2 family glycosyltransferase